MIEEANVAETWAVIVTVAQVVFFLGYAWITLARNVHPVWTKVVGISAAIVGVALFLALLS